MGQKLLKPWKADQPCTEPGLLFEGRPTGSRWCRDSTVVLMSMHMGDLGWEGWNRLP